MISIAIINESTVLTDAQVAAIIPALQTQVSRDFAPAWGVDAHLKFGTTKPLAALPMSEGLTPAIPVFPVGPDDWHLVILDDSDQAGALGYHDMTKEGLPLGKVFVKADIAAGASWTATASHELLEMLGDPDINLTVLVGNTLYSYEACDACEDDQFAYEIDGVKVSDFVFPSWFETFRTSGTQFDFGKHITAPLQILPGGFIGYMDITSPHGWQQKTARGAAMPTVAAFTEVGYLARPRPGSRRERRRTPREQWMRSRV